MRPLRSVLEMMKRLLPHNQFFLVGVTLYFICVPFVNSERYAHNGPFPSSAQLSFHSPQSSNHMVRSLGKLGFGSDHLQGFFIPFLIDGLSHITSTAVELLVLLNQPLENRLMPKNALAGGINPAPQLAAVITADSGGIQFILAVIAERKLVFHFAWAAITFSIVQS